jgi:hypothetical protein
MGANAKAPGSALVEVGLAVVWSVINGWTIGEGGVLEGEVHRVGRGYPFTDTPAGFRDCVGARRAASVDRAEGAGVLRAQ